MTKQQTVDIFDNFIRYTACVAVAITFGMFAIFGLLAISVSDDEIPRKLLFEMLGIFLGAFIFVFVSMKPDSVALWLPGKDALWRVALRLPVYATGFIGGIWMALQYTATTR